MKELRIAVIGYGGMGKKYVQMLYNREIKHAVITGVCCRNQAGQEELRCLYPDLSVYKDVDDTFRHGDEFDAVVIVTPHISHVEIGKKAAQAGKHILSDKPAGVSAKEVKELLAEVKKAGVSYGIIFNVRANPVFRKAKELLEQGILGELERVVWICNTWYRTPAYHHSAPWRSSWNGECGGLLINQCQHYLDIWQWLFGMPDALFAQLDYGRYNDFSVEDNADLQFYYKKGIHGTFISSSGENPGVNRMEIWGTKGRLCIEDTSRIFLDENEMDTRQFAMENKEIYASLPHHIREIAVDEETRTGYQILFQNFTDHVLGGTPLMASGEDGLHAIELTNASYLSSWKEKKMTFPIDDEEYVRLLEEKKMWEKQQILKQSL